MAPPGPAAGSPFPGRSLGAGRRVGPFLAPGNAWALAQGHHVGAPGVATCSQNQPPRTAPRMGPSPAPNWPKRHSRPGFSPKPIWRGLRHPLKTGDRLSPDPSLKTASTRIPRCLVALLTHRGSAPTWRRQRRQLQRQLQQTIWRTCKTAARNGQTT